MALALPCTFCTSLQLQRRSFPINRRHSPIFRRGATTCEYQIPVEISSPADRGSLAVPSHKVTVHDRQRGVVHEFEVPEGYALLCVGFPTSDLEVETQDEDEVYWLQFRRYFARKFYGHWGILTVLWMFTLQERDDYAFELAMGDE